MKNILAFLFLAVFVTATAPAFAADYTADEIAFMTSKAVFEDPATEKKMRSIMPDAMGKLNTITSGTTGAVTIPALAATTASSGATLVGVYDVGAYFTATALEGVLAELGLFKSNLALTTTPGGASYIGVFDTAGYFTGTDVEAVLAEIGLELTTTAELVDTPIAGNFLSTDALGQPVMLAYAPTDFALASSVINKFLSTGNMHDIVNGAIGGDFFPAAPADGYRLFCTADGGVFVEGKIYEYDSVDGWDSGNNVLAGEIVQTRGGDIIVGGATLADSVKLSDFALDSYLDGLIADTVDVASDTIPADPGVDGYRVFMTATDTTYDEGKIYTWDDDTNTYDSGVLLAEGQFVTTKGSSPDMIVGGTGPTDYEQLSKKLDADKLACKDITVGLGSATPAATAADPDWVNAYYLSASPVSAADQVVASVTIAGDGAVTLVLATASTAESVYRVCAILD